MVLIMSLKISSLSALGLLGAAAVAGATGIGYTTEQFTQNLDHFNFAESRTFQQRYLTNSTSWSAGGPIFFYTGNEGDITLFAENTGKTQF